MLLEALPRGWHRPHGGRELEQLYPDYFTFFMQRKLIEWTFQNIFIYTFHHSSNKNSPLLYTKLEVSHCFLSSRKTMFQRYPVKNLGGYLNQVAINGFIV